MSRALNIILALFLLLSCNRDNVVDTPAAGPVKVGLYIDGESQDIIYTKTYATEDGLSSLWEAGDKLAVWLPDAAEGLQSRSEYSIRLANSDVAWDSGYNVIYTF